MRTYGEKPIVFKFDHDETEYMIGSGTYQLFVIHIFQELQFKIFSSWRRWNCSKNSWKCCGWFFLFLCRSWKLFTIISWSFIQKIPRFDQTNFVKWRKEKISGNGPFPTCDGIFDKVSTVFRSQPQIESGMYIIF